MLTKVCHGVTTEPRLQPLSGESLTHRSANTEDGARLDIAMYGFWGGRFEKAFVDVRVFNPSAQSQPPSIRISNRKREGNTISKCVRSSMRLSHHWCCPQQEEWDNIL